ncbi:MAG TPA: CBS domain-containing protein [Candidatus Saccharimonadales bacterium]|nr:CBS domain-containing protein [Candidatus Saccharimonadales bacterium]
MRYYDTMLGFIFGLLLAGLSLVFWTLDRTYQHVPSKELKRLARHGDDVAVLLYRAAAYGMSLRVVLAGGALLFLIIALGCLVSAVGVWLAALVLVAVGLVGSMSMVPSSDLTRSSLWLAKKAAPGLSWFLGRTQPVLGLVARFIRKRRPLHVHTGLYEKSDLVELLELQKDQPDSRIVPSEIALLQHALTFGDRLVADALVPKRVVKMVAASDAVGPILMDELSKSGHSRFPVYDEKLDNIVGILYLHDLVGVKKTGAVRDVMSQKLTYVHENFSLYQTLQAFLRTKQHLFLVVNSFEELVGIITIEDVIEQMIGRPIVDEFDTYDDLRAVAAAAAHHDHKSHDEPTPEHDGPTGASHDRQV